MTDGQNKGAVRVPLVETSPSSSDGPIGVAPGPTASYAALVTQLAGEVRLSELVAALSLATDLGLGQPQEHIIRQTLIAMRVAELEGLSDDERSAIFCSLRINARVSTS